MYSPVIRISDMEKLEAEIAETLSFLETILLPSFFDIMVHLMVHLPAQARLAGPVHYPNMYPIERFIIRLKGYARTKSHPEGSIAKSYVFDESLTFCSRYLEGCETRFNRKVRNDEASHDAISSNMPFFRNLGRDLVGKCTITLDYKTWLQAHRYVLFNYDHIEPYLRKHIEYLSSLGLGNEREINRIHYEKFHEWFRLHVAELLLNGEIVSEEIQTLASKPLMVARKYSSYTINGHTFHTKSYDYGRSIQCSGVALVAQTSSFSGANNNPMAGSKTYYGVITEIVELDYRHKGSIVLFKCDWVDNRAQHKWVKVDRFGITDVNFSHLFNTGAKLGDEPFILASQATQVYYVEDPIDNEWCAVIHSKPRDFYDMADISNENSECEHEHGVPYPDIIGNIDIPTDAGDVPHIRSDIDGIIVDENE